MRATERELKKRHQALPEDKKKADTTKNSENLDEVIERHMKRNKRLYPLRINKTTVIYVTKDKCNQEYRQKFIAKINGEAANNCVGAARI